MKTLRILALALLCVLTVPSLSVRAGSSPAAPQPPAIIFLIRHAEKPSPEEKSSHLSPAGLQHAQQLPSLFIATGAAAPRFPQPDVLFATAESKHSNREVETLMPLSLALHLPIHHDFADEETTPMANEVLSGKYAGKVVLICWHHGHMPDLARALGASDAPAKISDDSFDQIWRIQWRNGKEEFSAITQDLPPSK